MLAITIVSPEVADGMIIERWGQAYKMRRGVKDLVFSRQTVAPIVFLFEKKVWIFEFFNRAYESTITLFSLLRCQMSTAQDFWIMALKSQQFHFNTLENKRFGLANPTSFVYFIKNKLLPRPCKVQKYFTKLISNKFSLQMNIIIFLCPFSCSA